jgi:hypothetical protein
VYAKLDISGRHELPAALVQDAPQPTPFAGVGHDAFVAGTRSRDAPTRDVLNAGTPIASGQ